MLRAPYNNPENENIPQQLSLLDLTPPLVHNQLMNEKEFVDTLQKLCPEPIKIILTKNQTSLIHAKHDKKGMRTARIQHAFRAADKKTLKALAKFIMAPDKRCRRKIDEFIRNNSELFLALSHEDKTSARLITKGNHYNLKKTLKHILRTHKLKVNNLNITWSGKVKKSKRRRTIKFGSYCQRTRTITIHPELDDPEVPSYFLEYIVYHEVLHAIFPPKKSKDKARREVHGPDFKRFEKKFYKFDEAEKYEEHFVKTRLG
jgi:predicted metal-dependent hydrolase